MKNVIGKVISGDRAFLEVNGTRLDENEVMEFCDKHNINPQDVIITASGEQLCNYTELDKVNEQLEFLTSDIKEEDTQLETFTKIAMSLKKNIKTNDKLEGKNKEFLEGLTQGKCSTKMLSIIMNMALKEHGISANLEHGETMDYSTVSLGEEGRHASIYTFDMSKKPSEILGTSKENDKSIIEKTIEENKKTVPELPRKTVFSKIAERFKKMFGKKPKALPEPNMQPRRIISRDPHKRYEPEEDLEEVQLYSAERIDTFEDRDTQLFSICSYMPSKLIGSVQTRYVELEGLGDYSTEKLIEDQEFKEFYIAFLEAQKENKGVYFGKINLQKQEDGRLVPVSALGADSEECIGMEQRAINAIRSRHSNKETMSKDNQPEKQNGRVDEGRGA